MKAITYLCILCMQFSAHVYAVNQDLQDKENTCQQTNTCKPTGTTDNPFKE